MKWRDEGTFSCATAGQFELRTEGQEWTVTTGSPSPESLLACGESDDPKQAAVSALFDLLDRARHELERAP